MPKLSKAAVEQAGFMTQDVLIAAVRTPLDVNLPSLGDVRSLWLSGAVRE
jgi:hypothetical protein